jgi:LacI family transcriptional regulator, galactose operon repressor
MRRSRSDSPGAAVTLQDVAAAARVSLATASRSLHDGTRAPRAELRERVRRAAAELGYTSNGPAQALARATTPVVGLIVHDITDPYFAAIAIGAMRVAHDNGLLVLVCNTFRDPALELDYLSRLKAQRARGVLLLASGFSDRDYQTALRRELSSFEALDGRVACVSNHGIEADSILPEHRDGARQVADHLAGLGHERIGVTTGPANLLTSRERLQGLRDRLRTLGRPLAPVRVIRSDFTRDGGRWATLELIRRCPDLTAIFALNDMMAVGALAALRHDLDRAVPGDVSVVGFDDIACTQDLHPPLTTVHLPLEDIGEQGMRFLLSDNGPEMRTLRVPASLVQRESSGPAPKVRPVRRRRSA